MMRWLDEESSNLFLDAVSSLNAQAQQMYGTDLVLANYPNRPATLTTRDAIWDALEQVGRAVDGREPGHAQTYLRGILGGFRMILRVMQGDGVPYQEQIGQMQQITSRPITQAQIDGLSALLDEQLGGMGYRQGSLGEKVLAFLDEYTLKPEDVVPTTKAFLDRCRTRSHNQVFPLPAESAIADIQGVHNVVYSGNSAYLGNYQGKLSFNIDRPWSLPTFANVLCHEGYPGHHAFYGRWDTLYREDKLPAEAAYYIKNTPTNALFEGVPENALHFLGWDEPEGDAPEIDRAEKERFWAGRRILDLQRMYQQNGCHFVNVEGMSKEDVIAYMMKSGLFQPSEAQAAHRFFTDATRRTYYPSYFYGRWMVYNAYRLFPVERRAEFFRLTYDEPHTTQTYIARIRQALGRDWEPFATEGSLDQ